MTRFVGRYDTADARRAPFPSRCTRDALVHLGVPTRGAACAFSLGGQHR